MRNDPRTVPDFVYGSNPLALWERFGVRAECNIRPGNLQAYNKSAYHACIQTL
jgi:hypothetical protein